MYCKHCGKELPENAKFCSECGSIVDEQEYNQEIELNHLFESNDVQETEPSETHKLFGFRSGKLWKKIVAIMYLAFVVIFFISALFVSDECDYTSTDRILTKISYLFIVVGFLLPYLWASDICKLRMKLTKGKKIIAILVAWILFVVPMVSAIALDSAKSEEYKVACEQKAEIQKEADNNSKIVTSDSKNGDKDKSVTTTQKKTSTKKESTTQSQVMTMQKQFENIGLSAAEAKEYEQIFNKLGLKQISNIEPGVGDGSVNGLQAYRCKLYDYTSLQINFTVENRKLCYVEIAGLPASKSEFYIGMFGNLKTKQVQTTTSVTMYEIWDDDGNIDYNKSGYLAVFDYENEKISEYNE
ncbi:MAG: zinc-ribbon domain-containing protein [Eubacterium sp.]